MGTVHRVRLRIAGGNYGRTRALADGSVTIDGVDVDYLQMRPSDAIFRMATQEEFDIAEFSLSQLIIESSRDIDRFVALPVFPNRAFRHRDIYLAPGSDVAEPAQLRGKRVAVQRYHVTASLWTRGILADYYGVAAHEIVWCKADKVRRGQPPVRIQLELPQEVRIERVEDASIDELLRSGRVDAAILPEAPPSYADGTAGIERLFRRPVEVERAYFNESGVFPIIHILVMRRTVSERNPGLVEAVYDAYERARIRWRDSLVEYGMQELWSPFAGDEFPRSVAADVDRFWAYGVGPNAAALQAAVRYAWEQDLTRRQVGVAELFPTWMSGPADVSVNALKGGKQESRLLGADRYVSVDD